MADFKKNDLQMNYHFDYFPPEIIKNWAVNSQIEYTNLIEKRNDFFPVDKFMQIIVSYPKDKRMLYLILDSEIKDKLDKDAIAILANAEKLLEKNEITKLDEKSVSFLKNYIVFNYVRCSIDNPDVNKKNYEYPPSGLQMIAEKLKIAPILDVLIPIRDAINKRISKMVYLGFKKFDFDIPLFYPPVFRQTWPENNSAFIFMPINKRFAILLSESPLNEKSMPTEKQWHSFFGTVCIKDPRILGYVQTASFSLKPEGLAKIRKKEQIAEVLESLKKRAMSSQK